MAINIKQLEEQGGTRQVTAKASLQLGAANDGARSVAKPGDIKLNLDFLASSKVSANDRMFFTEQLALMLDTGNSLLESLRSLSRYGNSPALKKLINSIADDVEQGQSFSFALAKHPEVFNSTYCNLVKASEQGGFMSDVLEELMEMDEKRSKLQATMQSALSYPAFLAVFSVLVVIFVLVVVFPKFADMFGAMSQHLPPTTKVLMGLSESLIAHWPYYIAATVALIAGLIAGFKSAAGRYLVDGLKLRVPIAKDIFSELYLVQSMRVMSMSMSRGVSALETLAACRDVIANQRYRDFFRTLENDLQEGKGLAVGFRREAFIPDLVKQMITTGESSGNLPKVMARVADYYERQLEKRLHTVSKAAEPVMLIVMGAVVGVLVSSLILPIFKMSTIAH